MQLSIIIVNYNVKFFLEHCLISVLRASEKLSAEVLVVDNHSNDGSQAYFKNKFPGVQFFWNRKNIGFSAANNLAWERCKGRYVLFLNPDTLLPEDCFTKCIAFLQQEGNNAALGVKMIDGSGRFLKESKRSLPDPLTAFFKLSGLTALFPGSPFFSKYYATHLSPDEIGKVDVLAGAFMMIPAKVLQITGVFDEEYFMYGEDIDLSYRIQHAGFRNYYFPKTTIIHFKGESTKKESLKYVKMFYKAMSIFVNKHYRGSTGRLFYSAIQSGIFLRSSLSAMQNAGKRVITSLMKGAKERRVLSPKRVVVWGTRYDAQAAIKCIKRELRLGCNFDHITPEKTPGNLKGLDVCILCEDSFSFMKIIEWIEQHPSNIQIGFYSTKADSFIFRGGRVT